MGTVQFSLKGLLTGDVNYIGYIFNLTYSCQNLPFRPRPPLQTISLHTGNMLYLHYYINRIGHSPETEARYSNQAETCETVQQA